MLQKTDENVAKCDKISQICAKSAWNMHKNLKYAFKKSPPPSICAFKCKIKTLPIDRKFNETLISEKKEICLCRENMQLHELPGLYMSFDRRRVRVQCSYTFITAVLKT